MYIQGRMQIYSTTPAPMVPATGLPSNITPDINEPATSVSTKNTKVKKKRVVPCSSVASHQDLRESITPLSSNIIYAGKR